MKSYISFYEDQKGALSVTSEKDINQGVISRFSPYEPMFVPGLKPGERRKTKIDVKVYNVSKTHTSVASGITGSDVELYRRL